MQNKEHLEFTKKPMGALYDVSGKLPDVVFSVCNELDLEIEEKDYRSIFDEFLQRIESQQSLTSE
ncbi:hypothetical protein [Vibrio gazogenes]|uniref:hypothetical protein n=1 Tax=Vibrio gazogenes TaxID=687 RepID=UPI001041E890|nr:hypothetical protein [Vibrio gazogenes]USP16116.1 hypothetical protein MKS89_17170 [Vibrio gazogenes]